MGKVSLALCLLLLVALSEVYEVQGTFLLRHYLRKIPRRHRALRSFALLGMLKFVNVLELRSPRKPLYKSFFGNLKSYMNFINSAAGSKNYNVELKGKADGLNKAISALSGKSGSSDDSSKVMDVLMSMGNTFSQQKETKETSSTVMTMEQRKEIVTSMAKWCQTIGQFVSSAASKNGNSIDMSSLGLDVDVNAIAGTGNSPNTGSSPTPKGSSPTTGGSSPTTGGSSPTPGGSSPTPGGSSPTTGDSSPTTGGSSPSTGGSSPSTGGSTTGGNVNVDESASSGTQTSTTKDCTTKKCSNGGGTTNGGTSVNMNYQQSGKSSSQQLQQQSQQTASGMSQKTTTTGTSN